MADTDILSLDEAKLAINVNTDVSQLDDKLALINSGVSAKIDEHCGPVVIRSIEGEVYYPTGPTLALASHPVVSVEEVVETWNGTETEITDAGYRLDLRGGLLTRLSSFEPINWTRDAHLAVSYTAGRYTSTETVEMDWKLGALEIVGEVWQQNAAIWQRTQNLPAPGDEFGGRVSLDDLVRARFRRYLRPPAMSIPIVFG